MLAEILHKVMALDLPQEEQTYRPRPSSAGPERCIRQMVYHRLDTPPDKAVSARFAAVLDDSAWHEELTADVVNKTAYHLHSRQMAVEIPGLWSWLTDQPPWLCGVCTKMYGREIWVPADTMHGHIDGIVSDMLWVDRLWEHKALSMYGAESLWAREHWPEDYLCQMALYLRALQRDNPELREGLLLVKNKNTAGFIEYLVIYDTPADRLTITRMSRHTGEWWDLHEERRGIVAGIVEKFFAVDCAAREHVLPARPYDPDHWRCSYCRYNITCWENYAEEVQAAAEGFQLPPELLEHLKYYLELTKEITAKEDEKKQIRGHLIQILKEADAKEGLLQGYAVRRQAYNKVILDEQTVPPVLIQQLEQYKRPRPVESLRIYPPTAEKAKPATTRRTKS